MSGATKNENKARSTPAASTAEVDPSLRWDDNPFRPTNAVFSREYPIISNCGLGREKGAAEHTLQPTFYPAAIAI